MTQFEDEELINVLCFQFCGFSEDRLARFRRVSAN